MIPFEHFLLWASFLLIASIVVSKAFNRLGIPVFLLFLLVGMVAGSEGPGGVYFDDPWLAQSLGIVALTLIIFSGGLGTNWVSVRPVLWQGVALSTLGVLLTTVLVGCFAVFLVGFSWVESLLVGAIVSSTDAAAVFSVMRSKNINLQDHLKQLIELESGSNDPMAVFLTVGLIHLLVEPATPAVSLLPMFVQQMALGLLFGYGMGKGITLVVNRLRLGYEGLYPVLTLSLVILTYGISTVVGGSGFLAVYVAGLVMANSNFIHKQSIMRFHDGLAWLMQITMFVTLGLLVFPSHLVPVAGTGLLFAAFLMFVARPASVFLTLSLAGMNVRENLLVSWAGLRGAAPIILATFPLLAGLSKADMIFNLVFFIVLTSILLQGTSIPLVVKLLGLFAPQPPRQRYPLEVGSVCCIDSELMEITVPPKSGVVGRPLVDLDFPRGALVVLLHRGEDFIVPSGSTVLRGGDTILVLAGKGDFDSILAMLEGVSRDD